MEYGLIGAQLKHSFSKQIHEQLADYQYELWPLDETKFHCFMKERSFQAINVTIPYKQKVLPYLDDMDDKAKQIGAVNTIRKKDGQLYGTNTDYDGFLYTLHRHHITVKDQKVLVLGDGGAAQAIKAVLRDEGCRELISVRRSPSPHTITYEQARKEHTDVQIIVNTSPCGMYPNLTDMPCDLNDFPHVSAYVDIIYNPIDTKTCIQAKYMGIPYVGGLEMLVAQAKYAVEFFTDRSLSDACIDSIYHQILQSKRNLVLIGMPSCGKTTIGRSLAQAMGRELIDLDAEIVKQSNRSIKQIILEDGEAVFRQLEQQVALRFAAKQGVIIACGGGIVKNKDNMMHLAMNGVCVYIKRDLDQLLVDEERPLSSDRHAIATLYEERKELYEAYSDFTVTNDTDIESITQAIIHAWQNCRR